MRKFVLLFLLFTGLLWGEQSSKYAGSASNLFLRVNFSASGTAMGNAATGYPLGINALFFNPAGLALRRGIKYSLNHYQWIEDIRFDNFSVVYQPGYQWAVAAAISAMWMPPLQGKDNYGNPTSNLSVFSGISYLGAALQLYPSIYGGVTLKYFYDYLGGYAAKGFAVDIGYFMYTFIDGLSLGITIQNIGKKVKYFKQESSLPLTTRVGISYRISDTGLRINVDAVKSLDTDIYYNFGLEYKIMNLLALRVGNQFKTNANLPTAGFGIHVSEEYNVHYSFSKLNDFGFVHQFGLEIELGRPKAYAVQQSKSFLSEIHVPKATVSIQGAHLVLNWPYNAGKYYVVYLRLKGRTEWKAIKFVKDKASLRFKKPRIPGTYEFKIKVLNDKKEFEKAYYAEIKIQAS